MSKYISWNDLCDQCLIIFNQGNGRIKLNDMCLTCRRIYNNNKALAFAERKGGKEYWKEQRENNVEYWKEYYDKNRKEILAYQKNYRNNKIKNNSGNIKQEQSDCKN